jgi:putative zinc finger protein
MNCLKDGILRAKLDGQLNGEDAAAIDRHLAECAPCRSRLETLAVDTERVRAALATLAPGPHERTSDPAFAYARFQARQPAEPPTVSVLSRLFAARLRPVWAGAALVAVLVACFSFAPARSWAQRVLDMLRVQKIAVVPIDTAALEGPQSGSDPGKMIGQFISDNIVVTMRSEPQLVANADQANQLAGFPVHLLSARSDAPKLTVEGEGAFQMTLNRDRLQGILDELGRSDLQLPSSIDGALVAVHVPKAVTAVYGQCPQHGKSNAQKPPTVADLASCVTLAEIPSPTVSVPPELNVQQLATLALEAAGMSAQDAQAFCANVDWTSTLVIPIPRDAGSYETTGVDGVQGTLITLRGWAHGMPGYSLLWVKSGIIYSLTGFGSADQAVPLADSLE